MSSRRYAVPLRLDVGASTRVRIAVIAIHAGALGIIPLLAPVAVFLKLLLALSVVGTLIITWSRRGELNGREVTLSLDGDSQWRWSCGAADIPVHLLGSSYVTPHLTILNFRAIGGGRRYSIVLPGDNCDRESLRRLRVRARESIQAP